MQWVLIVLSWLIKAFACSLVVFIIDLVKELGKFKHYLFFTFAFALALYTNIKHADQGVIKMFLYVFLEIIGIYIGLFILISIRNMSGCRLCDKIRSRFRKNR